MSSRIVWSAKQIDFEAVEEHIKELYFVVNIYSTSATFADVTQAYIRLVAVRGKKELARFNLTSEHAATSGIVFLRVFR